MARPKTVAILREIAVGHGEETLAALARFISKHEGTEDARMADVWERACETILDRIGLVPPKEPPKEEQQAEPGSAPESVEAVEARVLRLTRGGN